VTNIERSIQPWSASDALQLKGKSTDQIVQYARAQLSSRDVRAILVAFEHESYEMVATFVWSKAAAVLKKQVATLGMEFVGEMLGRPDLDEDSDPSTALSDYEAITLAEDLGMITTTQCLRLKHALELVTHFTRLDQAEAEAETMEEEEARILLKTCITSVLSLPNFEGAIRFADFRKTLAERTLKAEESTHLSDSPYFFLRTTISVLLSLIKTEKGAALEHALGNISVLLPVLWTKLRQPEKWQIGQAYAEVNSNGNRAASTGLKQALLKVRGFDFVPESLRSHSFTEAAAKVLSAHFEFNNYYNEAEPIRTLANLGTAIPKPAFAKCMEATLAVWLGNRYGHSYTAAGSASTILQSLRLEQWEYYLNECLRRDRTVLEKLASDSRPGNRWCALSVEYAFTEKSIRDVSIGKLVKASCAGDLNLVQQRAMQLRNEVSQ